ncbi:hypothetical protein I8G32_00934 [Rhodopseudomonas palustris]|nr:hypothetical protein I8G32_00934 [Rhodopseudomonas palustris]
MSALTRTMDARVKPAHDGHYAGCGVLPQAMTFVRGAA